MKKVLFLIHDLGGGGAEKVLVSLVNNMDSSKFDITVIALFGGGVNEQFLAPHIKYRSIWKKTIPGNSKLMKLLSPEALHRLCVKDHYDIEIAYLEGPSARIISGCRDPETKLIAWIHIEQHTAKNAARAFRSYKESRCCYARFDQLIGVSETVKQDFLNIYPGIENMTVCYNTMEAEKIRLLREEPVDDDLFQADEFKLIAVGKICRQKGFDRLVRIVKRLREESVPVHLYALGCGPEQQAIEAYVQKEGLEAYYSFLGYKTNPYKYIAKCDLFVCASWAEGFSTAAAEALIVGTPVCTVEVSGMKEMLGYNNEFGIVTKNDEKALYEGIAELYKQPEKLAFYRKQTSIRGTIFQTTETVRKVEQLLISIWKQVGNVEIV